MIQHPCPIVFATRGPGHHFFGYYDKSPLDRSGRRLLTHRAMFDFKRMPRPDDVVDIGFWKLDGGAYQVVAQTRSYNWQQGSQLQWLPPDHEGRIIFNDRDEDRFVSRIVDLRDGSTRTLPMPVYTLHPGGRSAICVNYERLTFAHPGYHYEGIVNRRWEAPQPPGDGLFRLDLESGEVELVVRTEDLVAFRPLSSMRGAVHYVEHAMFNPDGSRFCFLHRWRLPDGGTYGRLFSADERGGELRCLLDSGNVSHFGWRGSGEIAAWARPVSAVASLRRSGWLSRFVVKPLLPVYRLLSRRLGLARGQLTGDTYLLIDDGGGSVTTLAPEIRWPDDGHCTWRPGDPRWMLTDTYEDERFHRQLLLYDHDAQRVLEIGDFYSVRETCETGFRCDLHPRWDFSGNFVCIDSTHENDERQMYVIDVSGPVAAPPPVKR